MLYLENIKIFITMKIYFFLIFLFPFVISSCNDSSDDFSISEKTIIVDSKKEIGHNTVSATDMPYFRIKYQDEKSEGWTLVLSIKNFDYEEGYIYLLKVVEKELKKPLEDQPKINYELIEIISKTKDSDA